MASLSNKWNVRNDPNELILSCKNELLLPIDIYGKLNGLAQITHTQFANGSVTHGIQFHFIFHSFTFLFLLQILIVFVFLVWAYLSSTLLLFANDYCH